ncbi:hypothetical protein BH10PSE19_BH10PSE19_00900 [soil metagenome]
MSQRLFQLNCLGSKETGLAIFNKMLSTSVAYQKFITKKLHVDYEIFTSTPAINWDIIPIINKKTFYAVYTWDEIIPPELKNNIYAIFRSSGSSSNGLKNAFYWPQLKSNDQDSISCYQQLVKKTFNLTNKRTLFIMGLNLGSWAGGIHISYVLKNVALLSDVNMTLYTPGNQLNEILDAIVNFQSDYEQIIIAMSPSAIAYLEITANELQLSILWKKISYFVTGEPFSEENRLRRKLAYQHTLTDLTMLGVYSSADTGPLGYETLPLIQLRQFLTQNKTIAQKLGFEQTIPNMYHALTEGCYLEKINDELIITKWQGLPLIRYNLEDKIEMISWKGICNAIATLDKKNIEMWQNFSMLGLPDILVVYGRANGCIFLTSSNIYETILSEVTNQSKTFNKLSNGVFVVWKATENTSAEVLHWQIELKQGQEQPTKEEINQLYFELVKYMGEHQSGFLTNYEKLYQRFDGTDSQIFKFHFCKNTHLSNHALLSQSIKNKIIIENGPL